MSKISYFFEKISSFLLTENCFKKIKGDSQRQGEEKRGKEEIIEEKH